MPTEAAESVRPHLDFLTGITHGCSFRRLGSCCGSPSGLAARNTMANRRSRPRAEWQEQLATGVRDVREIPGLTEEQYQQLEAIAEEHPFFTTP